MGEEEVAKMKEEFEMQKKELETAVEEKINSNKKQEQELKEAAEKMQELKKQNESSVSSLKKELTAEKIKFVENLRENEMKLHNKAKMHNDLKLELATLKKAHDKLK